MLERRDIAGGQLVTESFGDGFVADSLHASGRLRPDIVRDLGLSGPAFDGCHCPALYVVARRWHKTGIVYIGSVRAPNIDSIRQFSARDARTLARIRRIHGSRRRVPRRRVSHADAAPAALQGHRRRPAAGQAAVEAAPPRRQGHVPRGPRDVDVGRGIHRQLVRIRNRCAPRCRRWRSMALRSARCRPAPATR